MCKSPHRACSARLLSAVQLKINATKSMIGHLIGAAGAVEAIAAVQVSGGGKGREVGEEEVGVFTCSCVSGRRKRGGRRGRGNWQWLGGRVEC